MKKKILLFVLVLLTVPIINAQTKTTTYSRDKFYLGVKVGANYSNVYDSQGENFVADARFGFAGGVFVTVPIGKYFGIQPEVLFTQKGYKSSGTFLGSSYSMNRTSNFIDVPLLGAFKPHENVTVLFGPQFSFLLKQRDEFTGGTITAVQEEIYSNDNYRKNTFCLTGGVDLNFSQMVFGLRFGWDVTKNNGDGTSTTPRYKNMWYQATIGYRI